MGEHYLPKHYLKAFAFNERLWVHDLKEGRTRRGQPKSEANVQGLWPAEIETHLANKVEGPAQGILDRVRKLQTIDESERVTLAEYFLNMWKRVPASKERTAAHLPKLALEHKRAYLSQIDGYAADGSLSTNEADKVRQNISNIIGSIVAGPPDHYWHHQIREGASPRMMAGLLTMDWTFMVSSTEPFLTCDDPLFFFTDIGIARPNSELSIPLSSSVTLVAHRQGTLRSHFKDARSNTVIQLNRRTAFNAKRFLYSEHHVPWALKLGRHKPRPTQITVSRA
ncbi:uncharacterized protein DUF4238 [Stenotrophomonas maltophilia]|uniref:DUF4238 domain-containing protein n=1 Tax=Stenotrophomonas chelatiphaga TaxID=517011 RepID=UPI000F4B9447|nr:DUF4238 domain-containing protein [Stenotrophomonas chelatiphaga]MCS4229828.1 hypothetical protein [Stenotrophomonas chelatiphaga]ROQ38016.1 uncharacterized protein DUF4238 [Stenotrophomonas maltophilia]